MDSFLTNRSRMDEPRLREAARAALRTRCVLNFVFAALMAAAGVYNTIRCLNAASPTSFLVLGSVVLLGGAVYLAWDGITISDRSVKNSLAMLRKQGLPEDLELTLRFGDPELVTENNVTRQPKSTAYDQILEIFRSETVIQLHLRDGGYYVLDPACFENGTEADFWRLMNEKCPNAVPKRYRTP